MTIADIPAVFRIRTAVRENCASMERLAELGITPASVAEVLQSHCQGWMATVAGEPVGFAIADAQAQSVWAVFILAEFEGRGIGRTLMARSVDWLRESRARQIWLTTGPGTRADGFYRRLGWTATGMTPGGEVRFELELGNA